MAYEFQSYHLFYKLTYDPRTVCESLYSIDLSSFGHPFAMVKVTVN